MRSHFFSFGRLKLVPSCHPQFRYLLLSVGALVSLCLRFWSAGSPDATSEEHRRPARVNQSEASASHGFL